MDSKIAREASSELNQAIDGSHLVNTISIYFSLSKSSARGRSNSRGEETHKDQETADIDGPEKFDPFRIWPGLSEAFGNKVKAEGDDDEEAKAEKLDDETDLHDREATLLG